MSEQPDEEEGDGGSSQTGGGVGCVEGSVLEEEAEMEKVLVGKEAVAEVKEDEAEGRRASGGMVVRRVSHWFSEGLGLRRRSPRPLVVSRGGGWVVG